MTLEIAIVLLLLCVAVVLFSTEWLPVDLTTLALLALLMLSGILTPQQAFSGFASEIILVLASIFVISGALVQSGIMDWLARTILRWGGSGENRLKALLMGLCASVSALISNTSATAVLLPATVELSRRTGHHPGRFLMPLAYASILGGTCTVIGTSTNIAASGFMSRLGLEPIGVLEFAGVGLVVATIGIVYMTTVGGRLLPMRGSVRAEEDYQLQEFIAELSIPEEARIVGRTVADLDLPGRNVKADAVLRGRDRLSANPARKLRAGDRLLVRARREALVRMTQQLGLQRVEAQDLQNGEGALAVGEAVLMPQSRLLGKTLAQVDLPRRFGLSALALYRHGQAYPKQLSKLRLAAGDVLLLHGPAGELTRLQANPDLWGLNSTEHLPPEPRKGLIAMTALLAAIVASALGWLPLSLALLLAAIVAVLSRCIRMEDAYAFIEWRLLVLIAGMTAFGLAMDTTGAAELLARQIVHLTLPFGVTATMAAFAVLTVVLTQPMSNASAALVVLPVALASAAPLGVDPRPLAILVTLSASLSFITPLEPACLLVYGPGKYRFLDFVRVGMPLTMLALLALILLVPILWPL